MLLVLPLVCHFLLFLFNFLIKKAILCGDSFSVLLKPLSEKAYWPFLRW